MGIELYLHSYFVATRADEAELRSEMLDVFHDSATRSTWGCHLVSTRRERIASERACGRGGLSASYSNEITPLPYRFRRGFNAASVLSHRRDVFHIRTPSEP